MNQHSVLRVITKMLMPFILIFALYVQFHGDFGPGGGFQAGVIFAAGLVLYTLIFGVENARRVAPAWVTRTCLGLGVLIFAGTGVAGIVLGGDYLDYNVFAQQQHHGQEIGILVVEFGVGLTVASAMISLFLIFAGQDKD
ncbi:MAG: Na(+)/H(+) antiporter subunit B [Alphaproteobacteria bacterium]|nr:Na(+)/H(+) antiporter subunit B [Alphaproteobacteria bacterium]